MRYILAIFIKYKADFLKTNTICDHEELVATMLIKINIVFEKSNQNYPTNALKQMAYRKV